MASFRGEMMTAFGQGTRSAAARYKSRRVGPAHNAAGHPTTAYRVLEGLTCGRCGGEIVAGALFLRRALSLTSGHGRGLTQAPLCAHCGPLTTTEGGPQDG
ncbi:MAG: hypothetical protein LC769_12375 [Chloroflexi bacterium]|nr:hypothetical protein [Chloroflexota bacterium]